MIAGLKTRLDLVRSSLVEFERRLRAEEAGREQIRPRSFIDADSEYEASPEGCAIRISSAIWR